MNRIGIGFLPVNLAGLELALDLISNFAVLGKDSDWLVSALDSLDQCGGLASASDSLKNARALAGLNPV